MVEFALVFPIFLAILLLIFEAGRFMAAWTTLANGVQTGARVATVRPTDSTAIQNAVTGGVLFVTSPTINITQGTGPAGATVKVEASTVYQFNPVYATLLRTVFANTVTISHQATMYVEGPS